MQSWKTTGHGALEARDPYWREDSIYVRRWAAQIPHGMIGQCKLEEQTSMQDMVMAGLPNHGIMGGDGGGAATTSGRFRRKLSGTLKAERATPGGDKHYGVC